MRLNILIAIVVGVMTYGLTLYLDHRNQPVVSSVQDASPPNAQRSTHTIPDFTFTDISGDNHSLHSFKGKTIILNFWASWCPPCIKEFPHLLGAAEQFPDDIILIAVSSDFNEEAMQRFIGKLEDNYPESFANGNVFLSHDQKGAITREIFQVFRLPETFIIGPDLTIREKLIGAEWDFQTLESIIHKVSNNTD